MKGARCWTTEVKGLEVEELRKVFLRSDPAHLRGIKNLKFKI